MEKSLKNFCVDVALVRERFDALREMVDHGAPCEEAFLDALRTYEKTDVYELCSGGGDYIHRARAVLGVVL